MNAADVQAVIDQALEQHPEILERWNEECERQLRGLANLVPPDGALERSWAKVQSELGAGARQESPDIPASTGPVLLSWATVQDAGGGL